MRVTRDLAGHRAGQVSYVDGPHIQVVSYRGSCNRQGGGDVMDVGHEERRRLLSANALFDGLATDQLDKILAVTRESRFANRQVIFQKGDMGGGMLLVVRGRIKISVYSEAGREIVFEFIGPGQFLGEIALLDGRERTANATAAGECLVLVIERQAFLALVRRTPDIAINMMAVLCRRLREAAGLAESIAFLETPCRLARLLTTLAARHGTKIDSGVRIDIDLSQRDLGNLIAANRESVNRQLRAWTAENLIATENGTIVIRDPTAMADIGQIEPD